MNDVRTELKDSLSEFIKTSMEATATSQEATTRLEYLEKYVDRRFTNLEIEMKNVTSHLSNLVREISTINELLKDELKDARDQRNLEQKYLKEQGDRWYRYVEVTVKEVWDISKKPLALFIAAFLGWWVSTHLTLKNDLDFKPPIVQSGELRGNQ